MDHLEFLERIKRLAIVAMFSDDDLLERLVLKGGNLLDVVYGISTRASVDVDFSIDGEFDAVETLREKVSHTLLSTFAEAGYVAFDINVREVPPYLSDDVRDFWGGYQVDFKIIEKARHETLKGNIEALRRNARSVGKRGSTKFAIEISKHEYCRPKQADSLEGYTIYCYSPEMVVSEKLRAICQQMPEYVAVVKSHPSARARDFIDIHTMGEHFVIDWKSDRFTRIVKEMFAVKRVPLRLIGVIGEYREYHRPDFAGVTSTVKPGVELKEFDYYFDHVVGKCRELETLWNE